MRKAPVTLLFPMLFALAANAQTIPVVAPLSSGCGPSNVKFDVKLDRNDHRLGQPESDKALVYVIEVFHRPESELGTPTIRVGVNGKWAGANRGTSYFSFPVAAGENRLCVNWQSMLSQLSHQHAVNTFVAESGKTYFFKVQITHSADDIWSYDFTPISPEEGESFIASVPLSISRTKK
jgi:hypothetical protein